LVARLEEGRGRPLTLVCAPAGYGKSTLLSHWLASSEVASAWLSLDGRDDDLRTFLSYVTAALDKAFPGACW
jgi:LuxR family maltose regulon positive regulatory protein